jgi:adenylylsulfate kinase
VWITGLPASGKSTLAVELARQMRELGIDLTVLESDALRKMFSTNSSPSSYDERDREYFYGALAFIGHVLTEHGIVVIFDATANRRSYRARARHQIPRFAEVFVDCPLDVCIRRDPKGIYRKAREGNASHVPGVQTVYEPPEGPDIVIPGDQDDPREAARRVIDVLVNKGFLSPSNRPRSPRLSMFLSTAPFVSVGAWSGMSGIVLGLWALTGLQGGSETTGWIWLAGILMLLLLGGVFLLAHGIIDLIRDVRKSIHTRTHLPHRPAR